MYLNIIGCIILYACEFTDNVGQQICRHPGGGLVFRDVPAGVSRKWGATWAHMIECYRTVSLLPSNLLAPVPGRPPHFWEACWRGPCGLQGG